MIGGATCRGHAVRAAEGEPGTGRHAPGRLGSRYTLAAFHARLQSWMGERLIVAGTKTG